MKLFLLTSVLLFLSNILFAQNFNGQISFTPSEKQRHLQTLDQLMDQSSNCLEGELKTHQDFFRRHGFSMYYGDRSQFARMSWTERQNHLRSLGKDPRFVEVMKPTSCIGLALQCLREGFQAADQADLWQRIAAYTRLNNQYGNALQKALQELGWRLVYWNPAPERNEMWDEAEKRRNPTNSDRFWGYHAYRYLTVNRHNRYYYNFVDDKDWLVGFGTNVPRDFKQVPFFVGTAHTGYHVFPGYFGQVIEGHSTRPLTDFDTIESSPFNPLQNGGGPRGQYRTGLMAVPPGY